MWKYWKRKNFKNNKTDIKNNKFIKNKHKIKFVIEITNRDEINKREGKTNSKNKDNKTLEKKEGDGNKKEKGWVKEK